MIKIVGLLLVGIILGFTLRKRTDVSSKASRVVKYTIYALLFLLGVLVGRNSEIINNLPTIGAKALLISIAAVFGSIVAAWAVLKYIFKGKI